ncbi:MAG: Rid family hydrolase [Rhodospirillaceae bacterium]
MAKKAGISVKKCQGRTGGTEYFMIVEAPAGLSYAEQLAAVESRYEQARLDLGLDPQTAIFRRLFLSDTMNQAQLAQSSPLFSTAAAGPVAVSLVQQPPLPESKIALLAYHIDSDAPVIKKRLSPKHLLIEKNNVKHLWSTRLCAGAYGSAASVVTQTGKIFGDLITTLGEHGGNLRDHCVRTWLYLKEVDVFYQGMVDRRTELFNQHGLTAETHYISSTGIQGACPHRYDLVSMDAYSIVDLAQNQMSFLNDFNYLCPTKDYNVTFERGTKIAFADRSHYYISGTASIDDVGRVMHPGNVLRQLDRTLENIDALLRSGGAVLDDMMYFIVYLRDHADYSSIQQVLAERFPDLPTVIVLGPVCRPEWLIEIEGIAVRAVDEPALPAF